MHPHPRMHAQTYTRAHGHMHAHRRARTRILYIISGQTNSINTILMQIEKQLYYTSFTLHYRNIPTI